MDIDGLKERLADEEERMSDEMVIRLIRDLRTGATQVTAVPSVESTVEMVRDAFARCPLVPSEVADEEVARLRETLERLEREPARTER